MAKLIMVVDDDPIIQKYLKTLFADNGYETCVAGSGAEAEEIVSKIKPDLITLDLEMPREWGPRFYRKMVKNDELNAFTTPGGNIYFHTGLLNRLETDDQIAAVLAHEIGHGAARHIIKKFQAGVGYNFLSNVLFHRLDQKEKIRKIAAFSSDMVMDLIFKAYSRQDEPLGQSGSSSD